MLGNYANTAASASAFVNAANFKLNAISQAVKDILHHDTSWQSFDLRVAIADRLKDFPPSNEPEPGTEEPQGGLIISEYVEGSGYNKALELTNMSSEGLSLEGYQLSLYSNGSSQTSSSLELSDYGTLAAGETLVIANSQASADITARSDASSGVANFNGNDALVLSGPDGATLDVLGEVGNDVTYAQDVTLRRNADVTQGSASFDDGQWQTLEQDAVEGLGYAGDQTGSVDGGVGEGDTGSEPRRR
ncbi:lamin tail domain-containing protein [Modicisalibacter luteus]|uniref:lamin tail domain-containing protein n=1 Tax=Modicisalibacter luteus TaxID=453962 RepID=UPI00363104E4